MSMIVRSVRHLPTKNRPFPCTSPAIIPNNAQATDHPVARNHIGNGIVAYCIPYRAGGAGLADAFCNILVRNDTAFGDPQERLPYLDLEVRSFQE